MTDAYLVEFKAIVFAESQTEANERVRIWRSLAVASGFEPGPGRVSRLRENELQPAVVQALEKARAKGNGLASDHARRRAIAALATHVAGDVDFATEVVESIEHEIGRLPSVVASALGHARREVQAA